MRQRNCKYCKQLYTDLASFPSLQVLKSYPLINPSIAEFPGELRMTAMRGPGLAEEKTNDHL